MSWASDITGGVSGLTGVALWRVGAIALFTGFVISSSYLGYQWHSAASDRDKAVQERKEAQTARDAALEEVGGLKALVSRQNDAIIRASNVTSEAANRYAQAVTKSSNYEQQVNALLRQQDAQPRSENCAQALARQRRAVEGVNSIKGPQ